ncbi:unknown [Clostridium sp. CAG:768]|nr:unknown [Clostridium sp. CAG:768]
MEFLKNLFKDDEKIIGLCSFKKKETTKIYSFTPQFSATKLIYSTNTKNNFLLS